MKEITEYEHEELEPEWSSYQEYLDSDEWKGIRWEALCRDHGRCRDCGVEATEVHHVAYPKVLRGEDLDDLLSLCHACHQRRHAEPRMGALEWLAGIDPDSPLGRMVQSRRRD